MTTVAKNDSLDDAGSGSYTKTPAAGCQGSLGQDSLVRRDSVPFVLATSEVDSRPSATERV